MWVEHQAPQIMHDQWALIKREQNKLRGLVADAPILRKPAATLSLNEQKLGAMAGAHSSDFDSREKAHCHPQLLPVSDCLVCGARFCSKCAYEILKNPKTQNCYCCANFFQALTSALHEAGSSNAMSTCRSWCTPRKLRGVACERVCAACKLSLIHI